MPANKETLRNCALTWFRLLVIRAETDGRRDESFDPQDPDVQRTSEYFQSAVNADERNSVTLCLFALFLERKGDYIEAEGNVYWISLKNRNISIFRFLSSIVGK